MLLVQQPLLLALLLGVIAIIQLAIRFTKTRLIFAAAVCLIDTVWEVGIIKSGQYVYHAGLPSLGGMPVWLPIGWIVAGLALVELYLFLEAHLSKLKV